MYDKPPWSLELLDRGRQQCNPKPCCKLTLPVPFGFGKLQLTRRAFKIDSDVWRVKLNIMNRRKLSKPF